MTNYTFSRISYTQSLVFRCSHAGDTTFFQLGLCPPPQLKLTNESADGRLK